MIDTAIRSFDLGSVGRVVHGIGALARVSELVDERSARRVALISNRSLIDGSDLVNRIGEALGQRCAGIAPPVGALTPEPHVQAVDEYLAAVGADMLVAIGGSSVSDGAKLAALRCGGAEPRVVVDGGVRRISDDAGVPIPLIDVPTTLSAGSFNAACAMTRVGAKVLMRDDRLFPWVVVFDPEVTLFTPPALWAATGMKAVDHASEALWSTRAHPYSDSLARDSLGLLSSHLARTVHQPDDMAARLVCQIGSWMSISCIANVPSYLSHVIGHVVGAQWHIPHGVTSGIILPVVMSYIAEGAPERAARVAHALGGAHTSSAKDDARHGVDLMRQLIDSLPVPTRLRDVGAQVDDFEHVARAVETNLDFFGTTPTVSHDDVISMLHAMW